MKKDDRVFVKSGDQWHRAKVSSVEDGVVTVKNKNLELKLDEAGVANRIEAMKDPGQKYPFAALKAKVGSATGVKFEDLSDSKQLSIAMGNDTVVTSSWKNKDGIDKEQVKLVQPRYDSDETVKIKVQLKRTNDVKIEDVRQAEVTPEEFKAMKDGQFITKDVVVNASTQETKPRHLYYDKRVNDILDKAPLPETKYFYGEKLGKRDIAKLNKGETIEVTNSKNANVYAVSYNPRSNGDGFNYKTIQQNKQIDNKENQEVAHSM